MFVFKVQTFKQHSGGVLRKSWLKICSKFTGKHSCQSAKQVYWNHTSVRLLHIFKTPFPKNKYGGLLLHVFPKLTLLSSTYFSLLEKCTFVFSGRLFLLLYSNRIRRFTEQIYSKYRKIRTRKNSIFEHFSGNL